MKGGDDVEREIPAGLNLVFSSSWGLFNLFSTAGLAKKEDDDREGGLAGWLASTLPWYAYPRLFVSGYLRGSKGEETGRGGMGVR